MATKPQMATIRPKTLLTKLQAAIEGNENSAPSDNRKPVLVMSRDGDDIPTPMKIIDLVINEDDQVVLHVK